MFRHRHPQRAPFADFINWTDYRWEPNAWRGAAGPRSSAPGAPPRRGYSLLQVFLAGLVVIAGLKIASTLRNGGNRSWLRRGVLAVLLLMVASYVEKRRRPL
jgi:hypothetical protein